MNFPTLLGVSSDLRGAPQTSSFGGVVPLQTMLAIIAFGLLVITLIVRMRILAHQGVKAFVFGQTNKSDFLLPPVILFIAYSLLASAFGWPEIPFLRSRFWPTGSLHWLSWLGLLICYLAVAGIIWALASFGRSFRVGIDAKDPGGLVTSGAFAVSRNPIYVCFLGFFIGLFLVTPTFMMAVAILFFTILIYRQTLREERFLTAHYGVAYQEYRKRVRRFL